MYPTLACFLPRRCCVLLPFSPSSYLSSDQPLPPLHIYTLSLCLSLHFLFLIRLLLLPLHTFFSLNHVSFIPLLCDLHVRHVPFYSILCGISSSICTRYSPPLAFTASFPSFFFPFLYFQLQTATLYRSKSQATHIYLELRKLFEFVDTVYKLIIFSGTF